MLVVGKLEQMDGTDFYNDDWNINDMESKREKCVEQDPVSMQWCLLLAFTILFLGCCEGDVCLIVLMMKCHPD